MGTGCKMYGDVCKARRLPLRVCKHAGFPTLAGRGKRLNNTPAANVLLST